MISFTDWTTSHGLHITPHVFDQSTHTAAQAAEQLNCDISQIAKSIVFKSAGKYFLAIGCGGQQINESKISLSLSAAVEKASAKEVKAITGYEIGGVPPFALPNPFFVSDLLKHPLVYASAGTANSVFAIDPHQLSKLLDAVLI